MGEPLFSQVLTTEEFGEAGNVELLQLVNFMSHENFEMPFCPGVNFIIGENGSGKSAILTALCIALGLSGKATNRTEAGMKDLIRTGAKQAKITLRLRNQGPDAYLPEQFGKTILIERTINASGGGSFKLRAAGGKEISSKKADLDKLRDHFNIDMDNPINIMTQDSSRQFLQKGSAKSKYLFYVKATLLEEIQRALGFMQEHLSAMEVLIKAKEAALPDLQAGVQALQEEVESFEALETNREAAVALKKRLAWALVRQLEAQAEAAAADLLDLVGPKPDPKGRDKSKNAQLAKATKQREEGLASAEAAKAEALEEVSRLTQEINKAKPQISALKQAAAEAVAEERRAQRQLTQTQTEIAEIRRKEAMLTQNLATMRQSDAAATQAVKEEVAAETTELKLERDRRQEDLAAATEARDRYKAAFEAAERSAAAAAAAGAQATADVNRAHNDLARLKASGGQKLALFGAQMPALVDAIGRSRVWKVVPIGPIGAHVALSDRKWQRAAEAAVGKLLHSFIVATTEDGRALQLLGKQAGMQNVDVIVMPSLLGGVRPYALSPELVPAPQLRTLHSVLSCEQPAVMNVLIDQGAVANTVLVESTDEGSALIFGHGRGGVAEPRIKAAFMADGTTFRKAKKTEMILPLTPYQANQPPRIGQDVSSATAAAAAAQEAARAAKPAFEAREAEARAEAERANGLYQKAVRAFSTASGALRHATDELRQREREFAQRANAAPAADDDDASEELQRILAAAGKEKERLTEMLEAVGKEVEDAGAAARSARGEADRTFGLSKDFNERLEAASDKMKEASAAVSAVQHELRHLETMRLQSVAREAELRKAEADARERVTSESATAALFCSAAEAAAAPLPPGASGDPGREELEALLKRAQAAVSKEERRHKRPLEEASAELAAREREMERLQKLILAAKAPHERMRESFHYRRKQLKASAKAVQRIVADNFNRHMQERGHSGAINVSYKDGLLDLSVTLANAVGKGAAQQVKDTKQLSGGERSYTTLCFTLSMNELSDSPFCAMDEWDVFMDEMHRKQSLDKMMKYTECHKAKQFLLLTPHDISGFEPRGDEVWVKRMKKPRTVRLPLCRRAPL